MKNDNHRKKVEETNLKRYGVSNVFQSEEVKSKIKETFICKYGVDHPMKNDSYRDDMRQKVRSKYGVDSTLQLEEVKEKIKSTNLEKYGVPYTCMTDKCRNSNGNVSKVNMKIYNIISSKIDNCSLEFRLGNYSYDIFVYPNILIEIDPTYTHNSDSVHYNRYSLPYDYHLNKSNFAIENGYKCIHIFDWDDISKVLSIIYPKDRVYARKCNIQEVSKDNTIKFLNDNHIQGSTRHFKSNIYLGLYYNGELVQIMTFGKPRYNKNYQYELLRLCSKSNLIVVGGASKLFKYFIDNYNPDSIISYCNKSKFDGEVYENIGMRYIKDTHPSANWSKGKKVISDNMLRARGFDQIFGTNYGKGSSNEELMLESGFLRVYDCGNKVFEYRK